MSPVQKRRGEVRKIVGVRLRQMRERLNYTQEGVAKDLSLAHSTISSYESGTRAMSVDRLADFAAYYGVPLSYLFLPLQTEGVGKDARRR